MGGSPQAAAIVVIARMREVCLTAVRLLSDQQPQRICVEDHSSGPPGIWLHDKPPQTAWIIVDIGARAWCQLAYQFGHELGHVLCNSWGPEAKPAPPCQWLEEAMVEAFSIRGLALLADSWERDPPFPGDASYAKSIRDYRQDLIKKYKELAPPGPDIAACYRPEPGFPRAPLTPWHRRRQKRREALAGAYPEIPNPTSAASLRTGAPYSASRNARW